jgi:uncharacterized membrane protein SpoIIM required for sporulation
MRKRYYIINYKVVLIATVVLALLTIMSTCSVVSAKTKKATPKPNVTTSEKVIDEHDGTFQYIIDNNTGVVYLEHHGDWGAEVTCVLLVNPDGTPVTIDQLEKGGQ